MQVPRPSRPRGAISPQLGRCAAAPSTERLLGGGSESACARNSVSDARSSRSSSGGMSIIRAAPPEVCSITPKTSSTERASTSGRGARRLQLVRQGAQINARPVREVRRRSEKPKRREPEGGDRAELDDVARAFPLRKPPTSGSGSAARARSTPPTSSIAHAQEVLRGRLVEARAPHEARKRERERLLESAAKRGRSRRTPRSG